MRGLLVPGRSCTFAGLEDVDARHDVGIYRPGCFCGCGCAVSREPGNFQAARRMVITDMSSAIDPAAINLIVIFM